MNKPVTFTEKTAARFDELIAEGKSMTDIAEMEGMPCLSTLMLRLRDIRDKQEKEALERNEIAMEAQAQRAFDQIAVLEDEMITISDNLEIEPSDKREMIKAREKKIQSMRWRLSRLLPKKYAERLLHAGHDNEAIEHGVRISFDESFNK
jgi:hypothetical protein